MAVNTTGMNTGTAMLPNGLAVNAEPLCHTFYFLRANLPASFHHEVFGPCARWHSLELPIQVLEPTTLYHLIYPTHLAAVETDVRIFVHGSPYAATDNVQLPGGLQLYHGPSRRSARAFVY